MRILTTIGVLFCMVALMFGQAAANRKEPEVTPAAGESWLHHLHRSFDETSMGKTSRLGPATDESASRLMPSAFPGSTAYGSGRENLHGADLYRLNCQGCHGETGRGAPPEIGSLIDPVRATSAVVVTERMKNAGMAMSGRETAEMVNQSKSALLKRLHEGGKDMPSFHHLSDAEITSLIAYLDQLAGVPGAEKKQVAIQESHMRVGELIVKSTCHTCHDATGTNPTPVELSVGAIPPLGALPARVNQAQLVRKVTSGAPVNMGATSLEYRSRMPVFNYLSEREAEDIYEYLTSYPPVDLPGPEPVVQLARADFSSPPDVSRVGLSASHPTSHRVAEPREPGASVALPVGVGLFTSTLLVLGCCITLREFRKLSKRSPVSRRSRGRGIEPGTWTTVHSRVDLRAEPSRGLAKSAGHKS